MVVQMIDTADLSGRVRHGLGLGINPRLVIAAVAELLLVLGAVAHIVMSVLLSVLQWTAEVDVMMDGRGLVGTLLHSIPDLMPSLVIAMSRVVGQLRLPFLIE